MTQISRRSLFKSAGGAAALAGLGSLSLPAYAQGATQRVVVVGGGFGGATAAKYLKIIEPKLDVTLVDRDATYLTCPFSNLVLGGLKTMDQIAHKRDALGALGVKLVIDEATAIDGAAKSVTLKGGQTLPFDRALVAPGIDFRWNAVEGYDEAAAELCPHAWKAGPQTLLLKAQLEAMPDGGTVIIAAPDNPFRCPPGPYERAGMIAHYLKAKKPKSKIMILDAKDAFSKQKLFTDGWTEVYGSMIEWVGGKTGGKVSKIDARAKTLTTEFGAQKGDVVNFIPPQRAGQIAHAAGLVDERGWVPVNPTTLESTKVPGVHAVGDAIYAGTMPKSGTAANAQAKVAAQAIVDLLAGRQPGEPSLSNTCYSLVAPEYGISVTGVYQRTPEGWRDVPGAGGVSPAGVLPAVRAQEALFTEGWYRAIVRDTFG